MAILIDQDTRLLVQGITGRDGSFHTRQMLEYGTRVVGGVTPGKGGQSFAGPGNGAVPIFNTVADAVAATGANTSVIYVPPAFAADAIMEAADAGIALIVAITEGVPVLDMTRVHPYVADRGVRLIGPNCPGLSLSRSKVASCRRRSYNSPVGVVSPGPRSPTSSCTSSRRLASGDPCVGIGGDPISRTSFIDCLQALSGPGARTSYMRSAAPREAAAACVRSA
jgi:succinyl-CoA synthetase alpha subunit